MTKSTISGNQIIDAPAATASKHKKLPYQKPELVEINLSDDSQGKAVTFTVESTSLFGLTVAPS